jgi:hypothetical protein
MEYLGLHNKPKAAVHPEHQPTGRLQEKAPTLLFKFKSFTDTRTQIFVFGLR